MLPWISLVKALSISGVVQIFALAAGDDGFQGEFIFINDAKKRRNFVTFTTVGAVKNGRPQFQVNSNAGKATIM